MDCHFLEARSELFDYRGSRGGITFPRAFQQLNHIVGNFPVSPEETQNGPDERGRAPNIGPFQAQERPCGE